MDNMNNTDERDMQNVNTDETAAPEEDNALVAEEAAAPKRRLPVAAFVLYGIAAAALAVYIAARLSPAFADFFNRHIGTVVRGFLAHLTGWIPFSLGEATVIFLPVLAVFMIVHACRRYADSWRSVFIYFCTVLSFVSLLFSVFVFGFGTGYYGTTVDKKLDLDRTAVSPEELYYTAYILAEHVNEESANVTYLCNDFSVMPYTFDEMSRSEPWTYTHISGVYTYFTGEANINTNFPDYTIPYTAAHEMAHQRGIAREDEANFIAFLVCMASDDPYIRYSGYLEVYEYVASSLYSADRSYYTAVTRRLRSNVTGEMAAYSAFFDKYRENVVANVSETVNNTYLQIQGTVGSKSYGLVVDLAVAYYRSAAYNNSSRTEQ